MSKRVTLHSHSPTLNEALKQLRRQPASPLRYLSVTSDTRYAAIAWKRPFLTAIKRLARQRPQLASPTSAVRSHLRPFFDPVPSITLRRREVAYVKLRCSAGLPP